MYSQIGFSCRHTSSTSLQLPPFAHPQFLLYVQMLIALVRAGAVSAAELSPEQWEAEVRDTPVRTRPVGGQAVPCVDLCLEIDAASRFQGQVMRPVGVASFLFPKAGSFQGPSQYSTIRQRGWGHPGQVGQRHHGAPGKAIDKSQCCQLQLCWCPARCCRAPLLQLHGRERT